MSGRYERAYSDKSHISDPVDASEYGYSDDPHQNGNGIYNNYTVNLQPQEYSSSFRIACFRFTNTRRTKCMIFGGLLALCVLLVVVVAIASSSRTDSSHNEAHVKSIGLIAYGPDENGNIYFNPTQDYTYRDYIKRIDTANKDYDNIHQFFNDDVYIKCNISTKSLPEGKLCEYNHMDFGDQCQKSNMYGMKEGRPCVLLVLKMPKGEMPVPLNFTAGQNNDVLQKLHERSNSTHVAINCEGKTKADQDQIKKHNELGPYINYKPHKGFPLYAFLGQDHKEYHWPGMMIQFNTLTTNHKITVVCTAYGKNLPDKIYSTEFTFDIDR